MTTPAEALGESLADAVEEVVEDGPHPFVRVKASSIVEAARILREKCGVSMLHQISGVDYEDHMEVVYHFARIEPDPAFFCLKVSIPRDEPVVPTLAHEWRSANWGERLECIQARRAELSQRCQQAFERSLERPATPGRPGTPARSSRFAAHCDDDFQRLCEQELGAEAPAGAIRDCLEAQTDALSAACREALAPRAKLDLAACREELAALCPDRGGDHARLQCARRRAVDLPDECIELLREQRSGSR